MADARFKSFQRAFPTRELFRGQARQALIWSALGAISLCLLLLDLFLIAELLETRGRLEMSRQEADQVEVYLGDERGLARSENLGLLPVVWRLRDTVWGGMLKQAYLAVPYLRQNDQALLLLIAVAFAIAIARSLMLSRTGTLCAQAALAVVTRVRRALHRQSLRLVPGDLAGVNGSLRAYDLFTAQVDQLRDGVFSWLYRVVRYPWELAVLLALVISIHWRVALYCLLPLAACWYLLQRQQQRAEASRQLAEDRSSAELRLLAESFHKTRIVRGYGMEDFEHERFQKHLDRFCSGLLGLDPKERWSHTAYQVLVLFALAIVLFLVGSKLLQAPEEMSLASALLILATIGLMYRPLEMLSRVPADRQLASIAADRIYRYLDQIPEVSQAVGAKFLQPLAKTLDFEAVSYALPGRQSLLDRLDLKLPAGDVIALVSLDPLEARALAYLLPRFIDPQAGRILIDGEDIAWGTLESLRAETSYIGGTDPFFTGTVLENISCGNPKYTLQDATEAAKTAHAHNFILKLPQGYETVIGEHGEQLDAGQGFRLGLARAILRDPALLIIEEPTALLDSDTKSLLDDAYNRITRGRTVIFLPSRLSTLRRADRIVFLHRGKVEATGKHADLVQSSQLYRHWEYMRFNEFRHEVESLA